MKTHLSLTAIIDKEYKSLCLKYFKDKENLTPIEKESIIIKINLELFDIAMRAHLLVGRYNMKLGGPIQQHLIDWQPRY